MVVHKDGIPIQTSMEKNLSVEVASNERLISFSEISFFSIAALCLSLQKKLSPDWTILTKVMHWCQYGPSQAPMRSDRLYYSLFIAKRVLTRY